MQQMLKTPGLKIKIPQGYCTQILMSLVPQISPIQLRAFSAPGGVDSRNAQSVRVSQIPTMR